LSHGGTAAVALTVAGSDSGGGAGIQADLKTFHTLGVFGTSAVTAITCQNPDRVSTIRPMTPGMVAEQMERVFEAFCIAAAKTGMLHDAGIIEAVADAFRKRRFKKLVIDPVMIASSGAMLLKKAAIPALRSELLPLAAVVTPNLPEAEALWRHKISSPSILREAARALAENWHAPVLIKGGHLPGARRAVDVLYDGARFHEFSAPRVPRRRTHGTGCTYSAAIAGHLALGYNLVEAIGRAKIFVTRAIRDSVRIGKYHVLKI
jgi:hydroxymethylpyrimidine/phosphomethylpyrimidine kinase